jgi:hypothetical protein
MEYKGYNGTISVEEDSLTITHSGAVANAGGLMRDQPREIPLQAISGVRLHEATRLRNGWLTLGVGGASPSVLNMGTAGSDPNTVIFRHKYKDQFKSLHEWLRTVIEDNKTAGIDPSAVSFDAAGETRTDRVQAWADEKAAKQLKKDEAKMSEMLGNERPDIVAAAARMGWRMGGQRELKSLVGELHADETVRFIAQGIYEENQGILVLTDRGLLFFFHGLMSHVTEDFALRLISSVQTKSGLATGEIKVFVSGNSASISRIVKEDLEPLANAVRQGINAQHAEATEIQAPQKAADDPYEALKKLASLRDAGILSHDEFEAKKQELLHRM